MSRLFAVEEPLPGSKPRLKMLAAGLTPQERPGDYAQAVMDLGATLCSPKRPACGRCPWARACAAHAAGIAERLPRKAPKAEKPIRLGAVFWLERDDGAVLLRKRPEKGLLGGMMEIWGSDWLIAEAGKTTRPRADLLTQGPAEANWTLLPQTVRHTFTHFHLVLQVFRTRSDTLSAAAKAAVAAGEARWVHPNDFHRVALPTVMRKAVSAAQQDDGPLFS
jgi:A/G-specific adenine glycosylase